MKKFILFYKGPATPPGASHENDLSAIRQENEFMKYMLLMYANESEMPQTLEEQQAAAPVWSALAEEMKAAGVWISSSGLSPVADATTVRVRSGKTLTTD